MRRLIAEDKKEFTFSELESNVQDKVIKKFISGDYISRTMCRTVEELCEEKFQELTSSDLDINTWNKHELIIELPFDEEDDRIFEVYFDGNIARNMNYGAGLARCVYGDKIPEIIFQINECDAINSVWFKGDSNYMDVEIRYDVDRDTILAVMEVLDLDYHNDGEETQARNAIEEAMNDFEQRLKKWSKKFCKELKSYIKSLDYKEMFYNQLNEDGETLYTENGDIL